MPQQPALPPQPPPAPNAVPTSALRSPTAIYEAALAQRDELRSQLDALTERRSNLSEKLSDPMTRGADREGLELQAKTIDRRIAGVEQQLASADAQVASTAAVPGAVAMHEQAVREAGPVFGGGPNGESVLGALFIVVVLGPISIALARRLWRRGSAAVTALPGELMDRLSRVEQGVEAIAVEVERIGEGQRFMTRVLSDPGTRALGGGPAEPVRQGARDALPVSDRPR